MNVEKYTERVRGFIQSAQSLAVREGHQQFSPLHILKVLLDDSEGLAGGLIDRAGGNSRAILKATEAELNKLPKVSGGGAGQIYLAPATARAFEAAEQAGEKAGDRAYCVVSEWESMESIVNARPAMITQLDRMRSMLEDLGGGLGVTDPVSGEAVVELKGK